MQFCVIKSNAIKVAIIGVIAAVILCFSFGGESALASAYFGKTRKIPIYNVQTESKNIAISFDAAWGADKTCQIMDILDEHNCKATFFLVGFWVDKYPEIVKEIYDRGFEIGTHSNTHPDLIKLTESGITAELKTSVEKIENLIFGSKITLFRAPFGSYNDMVINAAEKLNLKTIQWDVDSLDWQGISAAKITANIIKKVKSGSIILCHNNADHIVEALPAVITTLKKAGYNFVKIGGLIYNDNFTIDANGTQIKN